MSIIHSRKRGYRKKGDRKRGDRKRGDRKRSDRKRGGALPTYIQNRTKRLIFKYEQDEENEEFKKKNEREQSLQNIWFVATNKIEITPEEKRNKREIYDKNNKYSIENEQKWKIQMLRDREIYVTLENNKYVIKVDESNPLLKSIKNEIDSMNGDENINSDNSDYNNEPNEPITLNQTLNNREKKENWFLKKLRRLKGIIPSFKYRRNSKSRQLPQSRQQLYPKLRPPISQSHQLPQSRQQLYPKLRSPISESRQLPQPLQSLSEENLRKDENIFSWFQEQQENVFQHLENIRKPIKQIFNLGGKKRVPKETLLKKRVPKETLQKKRVPKETLQKKRIPKETLLKKRIPKETLQKKRVPKETLLKKRVPKETLKKKKVTKETLKKKRVPKETLKKKRVPKETLQKKIQIKK